MAGGFARKFENTFRYLLPNPLSIAFILSFLAFILVWFLGPGSLRENFSESIGYWTEGLWQAPLLVFMVQMMLILVLGHSLALANPVKQLIQIILKLANNPAGLSAVVCFFSILVSFFNWGLGLVFGALIAKEAALKLQRGGFAFNYGVLGAAGYSGLMVWHGGLSGSAPLKVAEVGHLEKLIGTTNLHTNLPQLPSFILIDETIFSPMNIATSLALLTLIPLVLFYLSRIAKPSQLQIEKSLVPDTVQKKHFGAENIDHSLYIGRGIGLLILSINIFIAFQSKDLSFMSLNFINLSLLGMGLFLHGSINRFLAALDQAIGGAAGILVQFPLYFGIMGLMSNSGLISEMSEYFSEIATANSFPIFTFFSAGIINLFVPSGGGQWAIQGPILIETALKLDIPLGKAVMALAYGDQITNMLQPFWALPLLAITGLKAREIIPYTLLIMLAGILIFTLSLLIF